MAAILYRRRDKSSRTGMVPGMRPDISIRRAVADDADAIATVFLAARATMTYLPQSHTEADTRAFIAGVVGTLEALAAVEDSRIVGFAVLREDWLDHLYILPSHFGTGIGTRLLQHLKQARPEGFRFWVFQANKAARRFYKRHGCKAVELTDGSRNEEKLPDVQYVWRLERANGPVIPSRVAR